jgi:F-type H+-transporting ATPase subunit b
MRVGAILAALHINDTLLVQVVDFLLLLLFLRLFAWQPLLAAMEKRRRTIADQLAAAEDERQEAVRLRDQQRQELEAARAEAQQILERAQRAAAEQSREMLEAARAQAERLARQVREEIESEREAAVAALREEVADLVLAATAKLLRRRVDGPEDRRLVREFIGAAGDGGMGADG